MKPATVAAVKFHAIRGCSGQNSLANAQLKQSELLENATDRFPGPATPCTTPARFLLLLQLTPHQLSKHGSLPTTATARPGVSGSAPAAGTWCEPVCAGALPCDSRAAPSCRRAPTAGRLPVQLLTNPLLLLCLYCRASHRLETGVCYVSVCLAVPHGDLHPPGSAVISGPEGVRACTGSAPCAWCCAAAPLLTTCRPCCVLCSSLDLRSPPPWCCCLWWCW